MTIQRPQRGSFLTYSLGHQLSCEEKEREMSVHLSPMKHPPLHPPRTEGYAKEAGQWLDAAYAEFPNHRRQLPYWKAPVSLPTYPGKQDVNCYR